MRKFITIISAILLVLSLSQCKKKPVVTDNGPEPVSITLNVNAGSKVLVTPSTGEVAFENGDVIYVAYKGKYVGTIIHNGSCFTGEISATPDNETPLYFYFLGNKTPYETLTKGSSTSISVDIIDQTDSTKLPVISAAASKEPFIGAGTYTSTLENKCALGKFNVTITESSASNSSAIIVTGLNNKVHIDFSTSGIGTFTSSKTSNGCISLPKGAGVKWGILLPQAAVSEGTAYMSDMSGIGTRAAIDKIEENGYYDEEGEVINVAIDRIVTHPEGTLNGLFTIGKNADGSYEKVFFSKGNLQYKASTNTWRFAEHQYDFIGESNLDASPTYAEWIDLFGWGTSGWNHRTNYYQPWINPSKYQKHYYAYNERFASLGDDDFRADWGYNSISNGGNTLNCGWRTLTKDEWDYLINMRSGKRYARAQVAGTYGIIILPDGWTDETKPVNCNVNNAYFTTNIVSIDEWISYENAGAVFIPAAGRCAYENSEATYSNEPTVSYWTASPSLSSSSYGAMCLRTNLELNTPIDRTYKNSVRLVYEIK